MTTYTERPWLALYREGTSRPTSPRSSTRCRTSSRPALARPPRRWRCRYFDGVLTFADLDARSDALAVALADHGFAAGDRLAVYLQNVPQFVIGLVGAWKAGGAMVSINPMNKARELTYLLEDSGATALLCLEALYDEVARDVVATGATRVSTVITCSPLDEQTRNDERLFAGTTRSGTRVRSTSSTSSPSTPAARPSRSPRAATTSPS